MNDDAEQIADADERREKSERVTLEIQTRLAVVREKLAALETAEAKRLKTTVQTAVEQMVKTGLIRADDHATQFDFTELFLADSSLIPLVFQRRIFRAGQAGTRQRLQA
jgi:hypothetical protein